jgi:hypothetical protein
MTGPMCRICLAVLVLLMTGVASAQENLSLRPPSDWEVGYGPAQTRDEMIMEYVKKGEKIDNWTELLTVQQFRRRKASPREFFDQLKGTRERACPGVTEWRIVQEEPNAVLYEWNTTAVCDGQPVQWELARLLFGRNTGYRVAYTTRGQPSAETRATWTDWLRSASLGR